MIFSILYMLCAILSPLPTAGLYANDLEVPTVRIYFSPLSTPAHIDEVKAELKSKSLGIEIKDETFAENGYLKSYKAIVHAPCDEGDKPIEYFVELSTYKLGATVIGEDCSYGSMNMSIGSGDVTEFFFQKNPPQYEYITWDGGEEQLMTIKGQKIFAKESPKVRIYLSPLSTQAHINKVKADLKSKGINISIKDETFSANGYLQSYNVSITKTCEEGIDLIDMKTDLSKDYLGAIVIGDDCQSGSLNMNLASADISKLFFMKSTPQYEYFTWDGGKEELMTLKGKKIFRNK